MTNKDNFVKMKTLIMIFILYNGCTPAIFDEHKVLPGRYHYRVDGGLKYIYYEYQSLFKNRNINSKILAYSYDEKYILVKQKPDKQHYRAVIIDSLLHPVPIQSDEVKIDDLGRVADSILSNDNRYGSINYDSIYYWIIAYNSDIFLGPMQKPEFNNQVKQRGIKEKLVRKLE